MRMHVDRTVFDEGDPGRSSFRKANQACALAAAGVMLWSVSAAFWSGSSILGQVSFSVGLLLVAIGFAGRLWVSTYHAGYKNSLITVGPYSLCRNPMYFCNLLGGIGACMTTGTLTLPVLFACAYLFHYRRVIRDEELRLTRHHGVAFAAYCATTPVLFPSFKHFSQPNEYLVRMRDLSKRLPLTLWPIAAVAVIHLGIALHAHDLLPVLIRIY